MNYKLTTFSKETTEKINKINDHLKKINPKKSTQEESEVILDSNNEAHQEITVESIFCIYKWRK